MTRSQKVALIVAALTVALSLAMVGVVAFRKLTGLSDIDEASSRLETDLKAAKSVGLPIEANDLAVRPQVADEDNAALVINQIRDQFKTDVDPISNHGLEETVSKEMRDGDVVGARNDLAKAKSLLDLARLAASKPGMDFHRNWDMGLYMTDPEFSTIKSCCRLLTDQAVVEAIDGEHEKAAQDIFAVERYSHLMAKEQTVIGMLVRDAIDEIAMAALSKCMSEAKTVKELSYYEAAATSSFEPQDFIEMLRGESYVAFPICRNEVSISDLRAMSDISESHAKPDFKNWRTTGLPRGKLSRAFLARHLEMWTEIMAFASSHPNDPDALFKRVETITDRYLAGNRPSCLLEEILAPMFLQVGNAHLRATAYRNVCNAMYRVLAYRMDHGVMPKSLADAGVTTNDPFTGKSLGYVRTPEGFRVYSVGPDRVDDHGNPHFSKAHTSDIVMANPPIASRPSSKSAIPSKK